MTGRILIVGGAGFIGSHLADVCAEAGCETLIYDNFSTGKREFLDQKPCAVVTGDILDTAGLRDAVGRFRPEVVYHLAAIHHIPTCEREPEKVYRANVEGLQSVLSAIRQMPGLRFVFASTGAVYDLQEWALSEVSPLKPRGVYALTKYFGEHVVGVHVEANPQEAVIARLFNSVGSRETNAHLVPDMIRQVLAGETEIRLGNVLPRRDYVHVRDIAEALFALASTPLTKKSECFNIGSGEEHSVIDVLEALSLAAGLKLVAKQDESLMRPTDRPSQLADISKIRARTGWAPKRTLAGALADAWNEAKGRFREDSHRGRRADRSTAPIGS